VGITPTKARLASNGSALTGLRLARILPALLWHNGGNDYFRMARGAEDDGAEEVFVFDVDYLRTEWAFQRNDDWLTHVPEEILEQNHGPSSSAPAWQAKRLDA